MKRSKLLKLITIIVVVFGLKLNAQELPKVAIIACDYYGAISEQSMAYNLLATGRFASVDLWNASLEMELGLPPGEQPTIDELMEYDAVIITPNGNFIDPVELGNNMNAFAEAGKGVILSAYAFEQSAMFQCYLQGEWENGNWDIVQSHTLDFVFGECYSQVGVIHEPGSFLVQGVDAIEFPEYLTAFVVDPPTVEGAIRVLDMDDEGRPLLYRHEDMPNRLDLGGMIGKAMDCYSSGILEGGTNFIANCLEYVCGITSTNYTLTLMASPEGSGIVTGGGSYPAGASVEISAISNDGFNFINWTNEEGDVISTDSIFTYTMPENEVALTANFEEESGISSINNQYKIYPNPASEYVFIETNSVIKCINIIDFTGRQISQIEVNDVNAQINVSDLKGIYFFQIFTDNNVCTKRIEIFNVK